MKRSRHWSPPTSGHLTRLPSANLETRSISQVVRCVTKSQIATIHKTSNFMQLYERAERESGPDGGSLSGLVTAVSSHTEGLSNTERPKLDSVQKNRILCKFMKRSPRWSSPTSGHLTRLPPQIWKPDPHRRSCASVTKSQIATIHKTSNFMQLYEPRVNGARTVLGMDAT